MMTPPALVLGCNTPHGINVLSDWIEEQTGYALNINDSGWSATNEFDFGNGHSDGYGNFDDDDGNGYGCLYGHISGDGSGDGEDNIHTFGNGYGCGYGNSSGNGDFNTFILTGG